MRKKIYITIGFVLLAVILLVGLYYFASKKEAPDISKNETTAINWEEKSQSPRLLYLGGVHYKIRCTKCHEKNTKNETGKILTDQKWVHSNGSYESILNTIKKGLPNKKMLGWENKLLEEDLIALTVYVKNLSKPK